MTDKERLEVINITMFGGKGIFGGRETRKEVVISRCAFADDCEALKAGRCASRNPRLESCVNMENQTIQGYTSRSMKHREFVSKWTTHEKYNAVKEGLKRFEHIGNNLIRIELPHINIEKALNGEKGYSALDAGEDYYVKKEKFDVESLKRIMESYSVPLMGGRLDNKEEKEEMLLAIKEVNRELYDQYMNETGTVIDYRGKLAYLNTLKPNIHLTHGWFWDGVYMIKKERNSVDCRVVQGFAYGTEIKFKPDSDSVIEIKSNDWVDDNTKFRR